MAVVSVKETAERRSGEDSFDKSKGIVEITRGYTRSFVVETDDVNDGWEVIKGSLPALNSFYVSGNDTDLKAVCTDRSGDQRADARKFWDCECEYSTEKSDTNEGGGSEVEEQEAGELKQTVRWSVEFMEVAALRDIDGEVVLNSAGDPFDPPAMTQRPILVANITRYETPEQFSLFGLFNYANAINNDTFTIDGQTVDNGFALFAGYDSQDVVKGGSRAKQVTYVIKILPFDEVSDNPENHDNFSLWDAELLEHGPNYIDATGTKRPVVDSASGFRYTSNLDETGGKLAHTADPKYTFFPLHPRTSFSSLGFDR